MGALGFGLGEEPAPACAGPACARTRRCSASGTWRWSAPHFAGAFVARDLGDTGADGDRRFDFFVTYERELVVRAARALMARIVRPPGT